MSTTIVSRVHTKSTITESGYTIHVVTSGNRTACVVTDDEYPDDVAFRLGRVSFDPTTDLEGLMHKDPKDIDVIHSIRTDLEETRKIMRKNIESVLERDEKLDKLVEQSEELSRTSKTFYKTARKANSCCSIS
jgi:synaptobrevin family protein YKT6